MKPSGPTTRFFRICLWMALAVGIAGIALSVLRYDAEPTRFAQSYLLAFAFWLQLPLACLAIALLHELVGGQWGELLRPFVSAGASTLPLFAILFIPVWMWVDVLFPWHEAFTGTGTSVHISDEKRLYLNEAAFAWRSGGYLLTWCIGSAVFARKSRPLRGRQRLAAIGVLIFVATASFAAIDWLMSLEPKWYSSIYGGITILGALVAAWCLATVHVGMCWPDVAATNETPTQALHDVGNLLLAFLMLWTYFALSQFLIIWSGDLPEEIEWYFARLAGGWQWFVPVIVLGHFLIPFALLLSRDVKRTPKALAAVAGGLLLMRYVELFWSVMPAFSPKHFVVHWLDFAATLAVGGIWLALFAVVAPRGLRRRSHEELAT